MLNLSDIWPIIALAVLAIIYLLWHERPLHRSHKAATGILTMSKIINLGTTPPPSSVSYTDKAGVAVSLPAGSIPAWSSDNTAVATVLADPTGLKAQLTPVGAGTCNITVVAEGDPTPGVDTITLSAPLSVVDEATGGVLTL